MGITSIAGIAGSMYYYQDQQKKACEQVQKTSNSISDLEKEVAPIIKDLRALDDSIVTSTRTLARQVGANMKRAFEITQQKNAVVAGMQVAMTGLVIIVIAMLVLKRLNLLNINPFQTPDERKAAKEERAKKKAEREEKRRKKEQAEDRGGEEEEQGNPDERSPTQTGPIPAEPDEEEKRPKRGEEEEGGGDERATDDEEPGDNEEAYGNERRRRRERAPERTEHET